MIRPARRAALAVLGVALGAGLVVAGDAPSYEAHLARVAPAVVTLRCVVRFHVSHQGESADVEVEGDVTGTVVDPSGLVLVSNTSLAGQSSPMMKVLAKALQGAELTADVDRLRVVSRDGGADRDAVIVVRDSAMDLAWVQVLDGPERPLPAVDVSAAAAARVGQRLLGVSRLARGFDYAPVVTRLYVTMQVTRPRPLWGISGEFGELGHLAFDLEGRPVGAVVHQEGAGEEGALPRRLLLPIEAVVKSLAAARPRAAKAIEEARAKAPADAPTAPEGAGTR